MTPVLGVGPALYLFHFVPVFRCVAYHVYFFLRVFGDVQQIGTSLENVA